MILLCFETVVYPYPNSKKAHSWPTCSMNLNCASYRNVPHCTGVEGCKAAKCPCEQKLDQNKVLPVSSNHSISKQGAVSSLIFFASKKKPHTPSRNQDSRYLKVEKVWVGMVPPPFFSDPRLKLHQQTSAVVLCCFLRLQNHGPTKGSQVPRNGLELKVNEGCREVQKLGLGQSK